MTERRRSRTEAEMENLLESLPEGSERQTVLIRARDFKAAWIAMGEALTLVRESGAYKKWGHTNFEQYCRRELHIRQDTANKLTRSFSFLRDHEPKVLEQTETRETPALDVVDLMSRAREKSKISDEQFETLREDVFAPEVKQPSKNEVMKRIREFDPDAFRTAKKEPAAPEGGAAELRKALLLAERLQGLVEVQSGVSESSIGNVRALVVELKKLFEESKQEPAEEQKMSA